MPEGLRAADGSVRAAVHDDPDRAPEPSEEAPRGWTWNRKARNWQPRQRGPVKWKPDDGAPVLEGKIVAGPPPGEDDGRDPGPSWADEPPPHERQEAPQGVKDDIAGVLGLVGVALLPLLEQIDPYCGAKFAQRYGKICDAAIPLITRSEKVVRFMTSTGGGMMDWVGLGVALAPVGAAVVSHHITKTAHVHPEQQQEGAPAADYSMYPAA